MRYQWQSLNQRLYLFPDFGKYWGISCIIAAQAMYLTAPIIIVFWFWLDERVKCIYNLFTTYYHDAYRTRSLLAVSKSIAAKFCIAVNLLIIFVYQVYNHFHHYIFFLGTALCYHQS